MRRAGILSLIVAMFALAGASVPPTRGLSGTFQSGIVWQAREPRTAPVSRSLPRPVLPSTVATRIVAGTIARPVTPVVRHPLFQRPPPAIKPIAVVFGT